MCAYSVCEKKTWKTQLYTDSEKSHRNLKLPSFSQNTAYYSTSMPWTVHSSRNTLGKLLMKMCKAVAFAQVNLTDRATPNSIHPVALVTPLLCLFTHTAVLFGTRKPFSCVRQRLGSGHSSLGHSRMAVTTSDRAPFTQLMEHIEVKIHMALPLPGWSRLVALASDDERVHHGRLQQPPTNVSPPEYRWPSNRVVRVVLVSQVDAPPCWWCTPELVWVLPPSSCPLVPSFLLPPSLAEHLWKE